MKRIVFVNPAAGLGGSERGLLDCVTALQGTQFSKVTVLAFEDGPMLQSARALGASTRVIEPPPELSQLGESGLEPKSASELISMALMAPSATVFLRKLQLAIASEKPDVVHTNGIKAHLLGGLVAPTSARLIVHLHDFIGSRRASKKLIPLLSRVRKRALFIANSQAVADDFARLAPRARVRTIYNVLDTDYFCPGPSDPDWLASSAGLEPPVEGTVTFGLVATYARWKGHGLFIDAAAKLQAAHPNRPFRFYIVGGPIYQTAGSQVAASELLERARTRGISESFGLSPFQTDAPRVYRALNVVVHASTEPEPFGRVIVEAMACQRPVLVARAGGAAELFQHGENAFGYESGNPEALAEAMAMTLDADTRERLGRYARPHAIAHFARARLTGELLEAYDGRAQA